MSVRFLRFSIQNGISTILTIMFAISGFSQSIIDVDPDTAWQGQSLQLTLSGTDLNFAQGTGTAMWIQQGGNQINGYVSSVQSTQLNGGISIPLGASVGFYDVHLGELLGVSQVTLTNGFEVIAAPPLLAAPTLVSPINSASLNNNPITFVWNSVPGAVNYEYQIATDPDFNNIVASSEIANTTASHPLLNNIYYWRVRTGNIAEMFGTWSVVQQFNVVASSSLTSITPSSGYQGQSLGVSISGLNVNFIQGSPIVVFEPTGGGNNMTMDIQGSAQFNGSDFNCSGSGNLNIPLSAPVGLYDVTFLDSANQLNVLPSSFTVLQQLPDPVAPTLVAPINGVVIDQAPAVFEWDELNNIEEYQIQININSNFSSPLIDEEDISDSVFAQGLPDGQYYWRVRAKNLSNVWGPWSGTEDFVLSGSSQLTSLNPDQGYAGQNLALTISGINLPFTTATSTSQDVWLEQGSYQIPLDPAHINNSSNGTGHVAIPLNAPTGYYDLVYDPSPFGIITKLNAFYVSDGNEYSGRVYLDNNQNQVFDNGDYEYPYGVVQVDPNPSYALSQTNGTYTGYLPPGNFTVSFSGSSYFNVQPSQYALSFAGSGEMSTDNDFALQPISGVHDMMISMNAGVIRQGRDMNLTITVKNMGPSVESGQFSVEFPVGMSLTSSSLAGYTLSGNVITWDFNSLQAGIGEIQVDLELFAPLSFVVGSVVEFTGNVTEVSTDETPADNTFLLENQVVNSYDPNFKEVSPATVIDQQFVTNGEYLNYRVHFQNTGTAEAIDVYILDTISEYLDLSTFQFIAASHDQKVNMLNNRVVEFRFDGINLPDSTTNEPESHGFVSYRIKPISTFDVGDIVQNTGNIYFDFNDPIITNTTENWIPVGVAETDEIAISISPNPSSGLYRISCDCVGSYGVYDISGRPVISGFLKESVQVDISELPDGIYLFRLQVEELALIRKLVKN